jgi:hypothetical protein
MQYCNYFNKIEPLTTLPKPTIYLDAFLASNERGNIQCYFHFIKLLHEVAHILTPGFISLSERRAYPNKIGPISDRKGDAGSGWEDLILGGRLLIDQTSFSRPFRSALILKSLVYKDIAPVRNNIIQKSIKNEYVDNLIEQLDSWAANPTNVQFPDLKIPELSCNIVSSHYVYQSREEAIGRMARTKLDENFVKGSRQSKRLRTADDQSTKLERHGVYSEEDSDEVDNGELDIHNAIDNEEDDDSYCGSIVCGGISKEMLAIMEKDPTIKF